MGDINKEVETRCCWLKNKVNEADAKGLVVGLSGGIDSALTAALAVRAFCRENVCALILPCYSNKADEKDAKLVAKSLGINANTIGLDNVFGTMLAAVGSDLSRLAQANIKSRLRMVTLYSMANELNYLVAGTSNKSEIMIGYYTKYGDGGVDLEPLGDLYKADVYEMARYLEIPEPILIRPASAGLWDDQTDEQELGMSYDTIELVIRVMEEKTPENNLPEALDIKDLKRIEQIFANTQHKREMPPVFQ